MIFSYGVRKTNYCIAIHNSHAVKVRPFLWCIITSNELHDFKQLPVVSQSDIWFARSVIIRARINVASHNRDRKCVLRYQLVFDEGSIS